MYVQIPTNIDFIRSIVPFMRPNASTNIDLC
jgi:hypothetical protein